MKFNFDTFDRNTLRNVNLELLGILNMISIGDPQIRRSKTAFFDDRFYTSMNYTPINNTPSIGTIPFDVIKLVSA